MDTQNDNYSDLSNLSRKPSGAYDWKNSIGKPIDFKYRGHIGRLWIKSINPENSRHVIITYNGSDYDMKKDSLLHCELGRLFNFAVAGNYMFDIGTIITDQTSSVKILKQLRVTPRRYKAYLMECMKCHNHFEIREGNYSKGDRCPYCSNHKIKKGFNDLWTTAPDTAKYLTNPSDGYKYARVSNKKVDVTCYRCGTHIGMKTISDITLQGVSCPACSDGVSYPNRFLYHLLLLLGEQFRTEVKFEWCRFPNIYDHSKENYGIYDAAIFDKNILIEMDSGLGHGNNVYTNSVISSEELLYRDKYKTSLALQNGYKLIRIACDYYGSEDKFIICRDAIMNSELALIYDLSMVDWDVIDQKCQDSLVYKACDLYNSGLSSGEISEQLQMNLSTVISYLRKGNKIGICNYIPYKHKRKNKEE